ncbi:MAG TPA: trigger factor [Acidimicrobiales bacterium]|nr:trigger factor [Acidimicrobiales bacterium]
MRATAEAIEGNRVKVSVEVPEEELAEAEEQTLRRLVREVRVPGFRPGKVPRRLLQQRLGAKAIRSEVISDVLPTYYQQAIEDTAIDVITQPEIDITTGEESGPLSFDAVVEVRPKVQIAGYGGLQITLPSPDASDEEVQSQLDKLRDNFGELVEVDRAAKDGDHVTGSVQGTRDGEPIEGLSADDLVYPIGSGGLVEGADDKLVGSKPGDVLTLDVPDAPGGPAHLQIIVKLVREKVLPEANDEWAAEASEFSTIEELRTDIRTRISSFKRLQTAMLLRERSLEALVELVTEEAPKVLVGEELERRLHRLSDQLNQRRLSFGDLLEARGETEEAFVAEEEAQAALAVKADLALRAIAEQEDLEVTEADLDAEIERIAAESKRPAAQIRARLERSDGLAGLRSELRNAKAMTWLVEHVSIVDDQGNPMDRSALLEDSVDDGSQEGAVAAEAPVTLEADAPDGGASGADESAEEA